MKKDNTLLLIAVTVLFVFFVIGFYIGRNTAQEPARVQNPTQSTLNQTSAQNKQDPETNTKLNINTATKEELESLPGIGPVLAERIIAYRQNNGDFTSISQLSQVEGIGQERLITILEYITAEETHENTHR